jgi:hypothetical protein
MAIYKVFGARCGFECGQRVRHVSGTVGVIESISEDQETGETDLCVDTRESDPAADQLFCRHVSEWHRVLAVGDTVKLKTGYTARILGTDLLGRQPIAVAVHYPDLNFEDFARFYEDGRFAYDRSPSRLDMEFVPATPVPMKETENAA